MSDGKGKDFLASLKKINCDSLPSWAKTFFNHIKRAQYVARMWKSTDETNPTGDASPTDYGWKLNQNCFEPDWFQRSSVPESFTSAPTSPADADSVEATSSDEEESELDEAWRDNNDGDQNDEEV